MRWHSFAREWRNSERLLATVALTRRLPGVVWLLLLVACAMLATNVARADQQKDPELREVVQRTIAQAECFEDRYESEVWYKMMEPRIRKIVKDHDERMAILKEVICESQRPGEERLPPGLVLALIHVESRFDHYAVSSAGAVGLMQVMPFWPEQLGMKRNELTHIPQNIRMGCAILRFYLRKESNSVTRALARYNGSGRKREYSKLVINQWSRYNGADDMGLDQRSATSASRAR